MEWLLNLVFSIPSLWGKGNDALLNERRSYERKILVYTVIELLFLTVAMRVSPSLEMSPSDGVKFFTYTIDRYCGLGAFLLGALYSIVSIWNIAGLIHFFYKYGIAE